MPPTSRWLLDHLFGMIFRNCDQGALTQLYAGISPDAENAGGKVSLTFYFRTTLEAASQIMPFAVFRSLGSGWYQDP